MDPDFPPQLAVALAGRPDGLKLEQLIAGSGGLTPAVVLSHLRKAERTGAVRYVRGRYELTVDKLALAAVGLADAPPPAG